MKLRLLKALCLTWLSILLTVASFFAQANSVDRRPQVKAAFEEFLSVLYMLSGDERFLNQLSADERLQYETLTRLLLGHKVILGPLAVPGDNQSSRHLDFKLRFSDRNEDFELKPGQPVRAAKVTEDVWFNLNVINNPKVNYSLLDTFQILFHEFGHKLGEVKNQEMVDRVAAKLHQHLRSYYREVMVQTGLKGVSFVMPYVMYDGGSPIDMQVEPILLLDFEGRMAQLKTKVSSVGYLPQGAEVYRADIHNSSRLSLEPAFIPYQDSLLVSWQIERKDFLIQSSKFNYLDLVTNAHKVQPLQITDPLLGRNTFYQRISLGELGQALQGPPVQLKNFNQAMSFYTPDAPQEWVQSVKVIGQHENDLFLEAQVRSAEPIKEILLLAQHKNNVYEFPGDIESREAGIYKLRFRVPQASFEAGGFYLQGLAVNSKQQWDFPERVKLDPKPTAGHAIGKPLKSLIWNGQEWLNADHIASESIKTDQVRMKFLFPATTKDLSHVQLIWLMEDHVFEGSTQVAKRHYQIPESIPRERLQQKREGEYLSVEFVSAKASQVSADISVQKNMKIQASLNRGLVNLTFVDQGLAVYATGTRLTRSTFASAFQLSPASRPAGPSCHGLF